ncbi:MAG: hypothetical protein IKW21_00425 [Lachnospiraceae bacterium]|nr:hypothetical protein [Lachnospiraceae bacterium]
MKQVLAACIDQVLLFDSAASVDKWEADMRRKHQNYIIKKIEHLDDGSCKVRIKKQYNNCEILDE